MSRFGCPRKIVTDNVASFKDEPLIKFYEQYGITLVHSTPYYPQGNGLEESSNKILINIIKILLEDNKKAWDSKMKFSLWADRVTTKRSLGVSPFQLVYGVEAIFPTHLSFPMEKFFQDYQGEPDDMVRRIQQLVEVQQTREKLLDKAHDHQQKIKKSFDKKVRKEDFQLGDLVLKWDAPKKDKGKHGKFEALWIGPFKISEVFSNNTYKLQNLEDSEFFGGPVNGNFLKKYFS
jgi:transposase InsO family protein